MGQGKDRGKHDGGRDASGHVVTGANHPESPRRHASSKTDEIERDGGQGRGHRDVRPEEPEEDVTDEE
jgi:hypothetical protein